MTLRVKLEVVPFGEEDKAREIGRLDIFQAGRIVENSSGQDLGSIRAYKVLNLTPGDIGQCEDTIIHDRENGAWRLLQEVLFTLTMRGAITGP